jgi:hypothetical protein
MRVLSQPIARYQIASLRKPSKRKSPQFAEVSRLSWLLGTRYTTAPGASRLAERSEEKQRLCSNSIA